jgi:hypothetical protein
MNYFQSRYFTDKASLSRGKEQAGHFNVLRRLDPSGHWTPLLDLPNSDVALVRTNMSLWVRPNKGNEEGWLGEKMLFVSRRLVLHTLTPSSMAPWQLF